MGYHKVFAKTRIKAAYKINVLIAYLFTFGIMSFFSPLFNIESLYEFYLAVKWCWNNWSQNFCENYL